MNWNEFLHLAWINFALLMGLMVMLWGVSLVLKDSSIADIYWGLGFLVSAWFTYFNSEGVPARRMLVMVLVNVWGLRLAGYLLWRNWGKEDPRYGSLRRKVEEKQGNFAVYTLVRVYLIQGFFMWVTALALIFALSVRAPAELGIAAYVGTSLWLIGMFFEVVGDAQLAHFRSDPNNRSRIMDKGLWSWTRHPNYFGEACVWFGFLLIAADNPAGLVTVVSPAIMLYALMGPTGKGLTERRMSESRPDFADYVRRTSGFFPRPPRKA